MRNIECEQLHIRDRASRAIMRTASWKHEGVYKNGTWLLSPTTCTTRRWWRRRNDDDVVENRVCVRATPAVFRVWGWTPGFPRRVGSRELTSEIERLFLTRNNIRRKLLSRDYNFPSRFLNDRSDETSSRIITFGKWLSNVEKK